MAVGLARLFGVRFPANFNSPFKAPNVIEFWQRWHMTLTQFVNQYVYTPVAMAMTRRVMRTAGADPAAAETLWGFTRIVIFPTLFAMILIGVWHGAGLQYLVFGILNGLYLCVNRVWRTFAAAPFERYAGRFLPRAPRHGFKVVLTFLAMVVAFVFFRAASVEEAMTMLQAMSGQFGGWPHDWHGARELSAIAAQRTPTGIRAAVDLVPMSQRIVVLLSVCLLVVWTLPNTLQIFAQYNPVTTRIRSSGPPITAYRPTIAWNAALAVVFLLALVVLVGAKSPAEFLYFQF